MTEKPKRSVTNLTETLKCFGTKGKDANYDTAFIIVIDDIYDGTVRDKSLNDGKLSDAGKQQLANVLYEYLPKDIAIILHNTPDFMRVENGSTTGVNEYGVVSKRKASMFQDFYLTEINKRREKLNKKRLTDGLVIYISGVFSSFDGDEFASTGKGFDLGNDGSRADAEINAGKSSEGRIITLILNVLNPLNNTFVDSKSLSITAYKTGVEYNFKISGSGSNGGYLGYSGESLIVEGIHGAQKTLIDAMAIWLLHIVMPNEVANLCIQEDEQQIIKKNLQ
ncbi:MAG: hypothetical protein D3919_06250 [Candidatus Electrothrix sp. AW5]|nr:hypothetical protein [Candidatus Electrothrix gigas]